MSRREQKLQLRSIAPLTDKNLDSYSRMLYLQRGRLDEAKHEKRVSCEQLLMAYIDLVEAYNNYLNVIGSGTEFDDQGFVVSQSNRK